MALFVSRPVTLDWFDAVGLRRNDGDDALAHQGGAEFVGIVGLVCDDVLDGETCDQIFSLGAVMVLAWG